MGMCKSTGSCKKKKVPIRKSPTAEPEIKDCFVVPAPEPSEIESTSVDVVTPGDILDNTSHVSDTVAAGTTIPSESSEIAKAIATMSGYGSNITVTFYHALNSDTMQRSWQTDWSESLDDVHYSYLRINNFQMKLQESMTYSYETGETRSQLTGVAILYPYFCPNQGDLFVYQVDDTHLGLFRIYEAPTRMSIKESTVHQIKFILIAYLTPDQLKKLNRCVEETSTFNLDRYLNDNGALLTTEETDALSEATQIQNMLINAYCSDFYEDQLYNTFIDSECLYDPYLVEFITKVIPLAKMPGYPIQLKSDPVNWKRCFWYKLLDPSAVPDSILISTCFKVLQEVTYRTAGTNALANRCYIAVFKNGKHPYPPFRIPIKFQKDTVTVPMQVRLYFDEGKVIPSALKALASTILTAQRHARFYYIPILIFLYQKLIDALTNGGDIIYDDKDQDTEGDCAQGCMNCIYACNPLMSQKKLCPGTLVCGCHHEDEYLADDGGSIDDDCKCCQCKEDITETCLING